MDISINDHASINITSQKNIYFDPFNIKEETFDADIIFITHPHYDHFSPEDIKKVANKNTLFVMPAVMVKDGLDAGIPREQIMAMAPGDKKEISAIPVEAVAAYNINKKFHPKDNNWVGYIVTLEGKRCYIPGDMDITPESKAVTCDIFFAPCGGTYTMDPKEAALLTNHLHPQEAIPIHYGSIAGNKQDGEAFEKLVHKDITVKVLI